MKTNKAFKDLVAFINKEYYIRKEKMTPQTTLEKDLGISGDDGVEFLEKFLTHFNIAYDQNREWQLHFDSEGGGLIDFVGIYNWLRGKPDRRKQFDLTLGHLVKVIESGYWIDMTDETSKAFKDLVAFINKEYYIRKEKMTPQTTLEKDLGITGDDGVEFLEKFLTHFNIQYDQNREWPRYFGDEGLILFFDWRWLFNGCKKEETYNDLTLEHLTKVIESGYWVDMEKEEGA